MIAENPSIKYYKRHPELKKLHQKRWLNKFNKIHKIPYSTLWYRNHKEKRKEHQDRWIKKVKK